MTSADREIRVLMLGPDLVGSVGGIQTHVLTFISAFSGHPQIKLRTLATSKGLHDKESTLLKFVRMAKLIAPFRKNVASNDIVHLNCSFGARPLFRDCAYGVAARVFLRKPVLIQFHGGLATDMCHPKVPAWLPLAQWALARMSKILVLSRKQGDAFAQVFPNLDYGLVPNFVAVTDPQHPKNTNSPVRFLFLARIAKEKGIDEIVAASRELLNDGYHFEVVFCGDGPDADRLRTTITDLGLENVVKYIGKVGGSEKEAVLRSSDVLLLPTRHREGLPYGILEAFAHQLPVIASDAGAIAEVIKPGINGYLLSEPLGRSLTARMGQLLDSPDLIGRMGANALADAKTEYSLRRLRNIFGHLYSDLLRE